MLGSGDAPMRPWPVSSAVVVAMASVSFATWPAVVTGSVAVLAGSMALVPVAGPFYRHYAQSPSPAGSARSLSRGHRR